MLQEFHMDFETRSACDLRVAGSDVYSKHESTEVLCVGLHIGKGVPVILTPHEVPNYVLQRTGVSMEKSVAVAHNARFEYDVWINCCVKKYGWPLPIIKNFRCTMVKAYVMGFPGSLDMASAAAGIAERKDQKGKRIMMQLCKPKSIVDDVVNWFERADYPEKFEALEAYCVQDVVVEDVLDARLPHLSADEKKVWELDQKINSRGIRIDIEAAQTAYEIIELEKVRLNDEMKEASGGEIATVTAHAQIQKYLARRGVITKSVDKAAIAKLVKKVKDPEVLKVLSLRQRGAKTSTAKFKAMLGSVSPDDGRVRGIFQYHSATTGRWGGRKIQPHNFPRPNLTDYEIEHVFEVLHG